MKVRLWVTGQWQPVEAAIPAGMAGEYEEVEMPDFLEGDAPSQDFWVFLRTSPFARHVLFGSDQSEVM
jgi:hypothetical protein